MIRSQTNQVYKGFYTENTKNIKIRIIFRILWHMNIRHSGYIKRSLGDCTSRGIGLHLSASHRNGKRAVFEHRSALKSSIFICKNTLKYSVRSREIRTMASVAPTVRCCNNWWTWSVDRSDMFCMSWYMYCMYFDKWTELMTWSRPGKWLRGIMNSWCWNYLKSRCV